MSGDDPLASAEAAAAAGDAAGVLDALEGLDAGNLDDAARLRAALLLLEAGACERADAVAAGLGDPILRERWASVASASPEPEPAVFEDDDVDLRPSPGSAPDEGLVSSFLRWFAGRRDLYAVQWHDETRRRSGYRPVEEPLTAAVARAHLSGRSTAGQYLLFPDASVSFAVIDLDLSVSALQELRAARGDDASPAGFPPLASYARRVLQVAAGLGLPFFPEDSGNRGLHLWLFLEPRRPARAARALLAQVLSAAGPQPADVSAEIFPKQDRPGARGLSSLVKLPLGLHQVTARRCPLLDDALRPIEDPAEALGRLRPADPDAVDALLGRRVAILPAPELETAESVPALDRRPTARTLAEDLRGIPPGPAERDACERMLVGCRVLANVVHRAFETRRLEPDEARAVAYTLGLVGPACRLADDLFAAAQASFKELQRVRGGFPSPMGCGRLRRLAGSPAECAGCSVSGATPYATPALLAVAPRPPAPPRSAAFAPWLDAGAEAVQGPLDAVTASLRRIEERLARIERERGGCEPST